MKDLYEKSLLALAEKPTNIVWHPNSEKVAIIMDPRYDNIMVGVIKNFMHHLNPHGWNLVIITHEKYVDSIEFPGSMVLGISEKRIKYKDDEPNIDIATYNEILMSKEFWDLSKDLNSDDEDAAYDPGSIKKRGQGPKISVKKTTKW